jgi:YgiT-type zinc finger domain-containing protein
MIGEPEGDRCYFCGGKLERKQATIPFVFNGTVVVIRNVPAFVCTQCGEAIMDSPVAQRVDVLLKQINRLHSEVSVISYPAELATAS